MQETLKRPFAISGSIVLVVVAAVNQQLYIALTAVLVMDVISVQSLFPLYLVFGPFRTTQPALPTHTVRLCAPPHHAVLSGARRAAATAATKQQFAQVLITPTTLGRTRVLIFNVRT